MAKSVVALLIGIALKEGAIGSVDDLAETYVPGLKDTEYGRTPIKALLLMASGVAFSEDYDSRSSDINKLARLTLEDPAGSLAAVKQFNTRRSPPGARFSYASAETVVLGLVLAAATKRPYPTMPPKSSGSHWGRKPMRRGYSMRPGRKSLLATSMRCSATGRVSA
jgi:CubicO group peptidase (beta-lactamase class C family)